MTSARSECVDKKCVHKLTIARLKYGSMKYLSGLHDKPFVDCPNQVLVHSDGLIVVHGLLWARKIFISVRAIERISQEPRAWVSMSR